MVTSPTPDQWRKKAWLSPSAEEGQLSFEIIGQKDVKMSDVVYGVYHGRFAEMLLTHFGGSFTSVTAKPR